MNAGPDARAAATLLRVEDLRTTFRTSRGLVRAVSGVDLVVRRGETIGIVGESGCGKSVLVRSIMGLYSQNFAANVQGLVEFEGIDLSTLTVQQRRHMWGTELAMVFQDPMTSLNPVKTIGKHLSEPIRYHMKLSRGAARTRAVELLKQVGISEPARRLGQYPHELSGGMRQRVCVALALACEPKLLIADEPTTALDVTVQRQVLDLLDEIAENRQMTTLLITHDLGVVAKRASRIIVMYAGRVVESRPARALFEDPRHPYTVALLASAPRLSDPPHTELRAIEGRPPDLARMAAGCPFRPRCPWAHDACEHEVPPLVPAGGDPMEGAVACRLPMVNSEQS